MFIRLLAIVAMATGAMSAAPSLESDFLKAAAYIKNLDSSAPSTASTEDQLAIYANFKVATMGKATGSAPWNPIQALKFNAWVELGDKDREEAMRDYIALADKVVPDWRK